VGLACAEGPGDVGEAALAVERRLLRRGARPGERERSEGRAEVPGDAPREERGLVVTALGEARRVERHGHDEHLAQRAGAGNERPPEQIPQRARQIGARFVLQPDDRLRDGPAVDEGRVAGPAATAGLDGGRARHAERRDA
jgi:hypothetical protein